jgi:hypothetical protein
VILRKEFRVPTITRFLSIKNFGGCAGEMNERKTVAVFHKDDCWVREKKEFIEFDIFFAL